MYVCVCIYGLPGGLSDKESAFQCRKCRFDPGSGRSPGGGHGNPLQYSCLENPMDRGAWQAIVHRVAKICFSTWHIVYIVSIPQALLLFGLSKKEVKTLKG